MCDECRELRSVVEGLQREVLELREQVGSPPGSSSHPLYPTWKAMQQRCYNPKATGYLWYGGRGITVCAAWLDPWSGLSTFAADMGKKPTPEHSVDRVDNDGNYEPSNCRWASKVEQVNNRRPSKRSDLRALAENAGLSYATVYGRLNRGWSMRDALRLKKGQKRDPLLFPHGNSGKTPQK